MKPDPEAIGQEIGRIFHTYQNALQQMLEFSL